MTTLPPIQSWFNSLDWNLSFYENKYRNCNFDIPKAMQSNNNYRSKPSIALNGEWKHTTADAVNEQNFFTAINGTQPSLDDASGITDDNRSLRGKLVKSTSLKTRKPENKCEPQRRKSVRFADTVGLDLECVRMFENGRPTVPTSAFADLKISDTSSCATLINGHSNCAATTTTTYVTGTSTVCKPIKYAQWTPLQNWTPSAPNRSPPSSPKPKLTVDFVEPFSCVDFIERVKKQKVSLQNCFISSYGPNVNVTCVCSVVNLSFEKRVFLRYTSDYWQTYTEIEAKYVPNSSNGWSDKFVVEFVINTESSFTDISPGKQILFAIRYTVDGSEYWDNNMGLNYSLSARL